MGTEVVKDYIYDFGISNDELQNIIDMDISKVSKMLQSGTYKNRILSILYLKPYIINKKITGIDDEFVVKLYKKRYEEERQELDMLFNDFQITEKEYNQYVEVIDNKFFNSSDYSKLIKEKIDNNFQKTI